MKIILFVAFLWSILSFAQKPDYTVSFEKNKSELSNNAKFKLDAFFKTIDLQKIEAVTIIGYTDSTGKQKANLKLSKKRAYKTAAFIKKKGLKHAKFEIKGDGSFIGLANNKTEEGRSLNRRAEIFLFYKTQSPTSTAKTKKSIEAIYLKPQSFKIDIKKPQSIETKNKLKLTFPQEAFETVDGKNINGDVLVEITEYRTLADMYLAKLTTSTVSGIPLQTAGMFYIKATANGQDLKLKKDKSIAIDSKIEKDYQIFVGQHDTTKHIKWDLPAAQYTVTQSLIDEVFVKVEEMPEFPGGNLAFQKYIKTNLQYPQIAIQNKIEGRVFVKFMVTSVGEIKNITVLRGVYAALNREAVRLVISMPKWIPGKERGRNVNVWYNVPITFQLDENSSTNFVRSKSDSLRNSSDINQKEDSADYQSLDLKASIVDNFQNLGWINCDKFIKSELYELNIPYDESIWDISIIIKGLNAILPPNYFERNSFQFSLPKNQDCLVIATKSENNEGFVAWQKFHSEGENNIELKFEKVKIADFSKKIKTIIEKK